jgi:hypothetical protein
LRAHAPGLLATLPLGNPQHKVPLADQARLYPSRITLASFPKTNTHRSTSTSQFNRNFHRIRPARSSVKSWLEWGERFSAVCAGVRVRDLKAAIRP